MHMNLIDILNGTQMDPKVRRTFYEVYKDYYKTNHYVLKNKI